MESGILHIFDVVLDNESSSESTVTVVANNVELQGRTDFQLCIKCQVSGGILITTPKPDSYGEFLEAVTQRAVFCDGDFPAICYRLHQYNAYDLVAVIATWHIQCHKDTVHTHKIDRAEKAYKRKLQNYPISETLDSSVIEKENENCNTRNQRPFNSHVQQVTHSEKINVFSVMKEMGKRFYMKLGQ